ncbi:MAG: serine/threonine protein phosphatase [Candidatus Methylomirabilota bacterium]|nr:serine/threonine protein phosphatase [Candidatus Methylomirabilis sp.]NJD68483.1 serine/threonine protein phosphatase [candidate division NC10 bacterium]PWB46293.1 MAG: serine/threonine protein phosphatase [candidate division NC10 bacterium]
MIYVIGDIHGCLHPLRRLIAQLRPGDDDDVVFLGDYVDRGPNSRGVIDYLLTLRGRYTFLMGNHERMFLDFLQGKERALFLYNGGTATLDSYGGLRGIPATHLAFLERLRPYHENQEYFFVHAGIRPEVPLHEQDERDLLWIRDDFYAYSGRFPKTVVFGHTPMREVLMEEDRIGIDTACVYGNKLTCLILPSREVIQVSNHLDR